jgi:trans-2-enoyl-CoA reductase
MKQVLIEAYGTPWEVARCAEVPDVGAPAADEVVFDVLAFPINPADMGFCRGSYRLKPPLPATPGAECVGRVRAVGASVKHVKPGDLVINLQRENWTQQRKVKGDDAIQLRPASTCGRPRWCASTRRRHSSCCRTSSISRAATG